jgi:hypothetical protein
VEEKRRCAIFFFSVWLPFSFPSKDVLVKGSINPSSGVFTVPCSYLPHLLSSTFLLLSVRAIRFTTSSRGINLQPCLSDFGFWHEGTSLFFLCSFSLLTGIHPHAREPPKRPIPDQRLEPTARCIVRLDRHHILTYTQGSPVHSSLTGPAKAWS